MTDILKRGTDESLEHWQLRIYNNRKVYGLSYDDMADLMNDETGLNKGESAWRKALKKFSEGVDFAIANNLDKVALEEYDKKKQEVMEERKKLQAVRVDYNRAMTIKTRKDLMYEMIKESFETLPLPDFKVDVPLHRKPGKREAVLAFGDAHWGKVMESLNNTYSPEIFEQRMAKVIEETVHILKEKEDFTHVTVLNLADSIEGMSLRISQLQTLRTGFIDQTISFAKFMAVWLNELSNYFTIDYFQVPSANHSEVRPFSTKRGEFPSEDFEKVIINYLHDVLIHNPRINIPIYKENVIDFQLAGADHAATHGHAFKINKNTIRDLSMQRRKFYQYLWTAHLHHSDVVTVNESPFGNVEMIKIPSIMGSDDYSDTLFTGAKAGAAINIFEEGKGRTTQYNIILN
jgi:hypothetical protein